MWQLAEAKNKFSEVFTRAMTEGPQRVRRRGETVVVLSEAEYERLAGNEPKKMSLGEYLLAGPPSSKVSSSSAIASPGREVDFGDDE